MSAFLGHIHYWLYRKIQLLVERENLILEKTTKVVDDLAEELHSANQLTLAFHWKTLSTTTTFTVGSPTKST